MALQPNPNLFYRKLVILGRPPTAAPRPEVSGLANPAKIFRTIFMSARKFLFSKKVRKFLRDWLSAIRRRRSRYTNLAGGQKFPLLSNPFLFARLR